MRRRRSRPTPPTTPSAHTSRPLTEAIALFEGSDLARRAFGDVAHEHLTNFFRHELDAFNHETVTDWELVRYFERV